MAGGGSTAKSNSTTSVRIVVAGDHGTGKSSLIITAAAEAFPANVPPVLPPTRLPEDMFPDRVPVTVIDTSSSLENRGKLADELKRADAVVLTYACDQPSTLERLSTFWLPELRRLEVKVPVIVAGCKLDLRDEQQAVSLEQVMSPIMQQFREIETCIECSAYKHIQIPEVFYYAQKAVLHPTAPLFDQEAQTLKPRCVRALKRIFILCDHDRDGALSDAELNDFQVKCFNAPLQPSEIVGVKRVVQEKLPEGVHENGLTLTGFLFLHALFIEKGRLETTWTVLRKFGYNNDIRLGDDQLLSPIKRTPDQSVELTSEAVEFLRGVFSLFDIDGDGALNAHELEDVFSTAPESPWSEAPYVNAAEKNALGGLSLDGFLAEWALMTLLDPVLSVENLIYIGYAGDPSSAVRVTRRRRVDRKKQHSDRNVFQCFVFGPKEAGKSSLLHSFVGRQFSEVYTPTTEERYTDALAMCDIAVFVHDSSNESSWLRATELLVQVASQGESTGYEVSQDMGIEAPIPISAKLGDFNNIFRRIVRAAEHPHLSIPETEAGKTRKQYHRLLNRSLMVVSVRVKDVLLALFVTVVLMRYPCFYQYYRLDKLGVEGNTE
ncbi:Calcium-binding EF-hand [Cynara cardunculus var. scolymus]|uniref:Mitochondrial Rho GTPase n=1 Tax=Cynara cardunculus var. scolymus TaxID=59895 RepID=A0A103YG85_CYNCS|nr:Calcium-binding EF-hand [Cynara cardunculus var. scolymus]